jgi:hypothetical protein
LKPRVGISDGVGIGNNDLDDAGFIDMLIEVLKYTLIPFVLVALWLIPDPIGKIVEVWRFFRGDRMDD